MLLEYIWKFLCTSGSIVTEHLAFYLYLSFFHFKRRSLEISIDVSGSIIMEHLTFFHVTGRFMDGTKMTLNILQSTTLLCHQKISRPIDWSLNGRPTSTHKHEHAFYLFNSLVYVYYFTQRSRTNLHRCVSIFSFFTTFRVKLIFLICLLLLPKSNLYFAYKMSLLKFFVSTLIIIFTNI